jgi:Cu-Zn family superoxide dismutase
MPLKSMHRIALLMLGLLLGGCDTLSKGPFAMAEVKGLQGGPAWGRVTFHQAEGGTFIGETTGWRAPIATEAADSAAGKTFIRADINGLPPNSRFGFHIHEKPDCTGDGSGAGGHFNPQGKPHARYDSAERHAGDLPNLESDGEGVAVFAFTSELLTVAPGPNSVVGRSIIIHASPDDFRSQPAGNSGARIACGVIKGE